MANIRGVDRVNSGRLLGQVGPHRKIVPAPPCSAPHPALAADLIADLAGDLAGDLAADLAADLDGRTRSAGCRVAPTGAGRRGLPSNRLPYQPLPRSIGRDLSRSVSGHH